MSQMPLTQARPLSAREAEAIFLRALDGDAPAAAPALETRAAQSPLAPGGDVETEDLSALLGLNDADFVAEAFQLALGRPPDPVGLRHYLAALAAGRSRILVLGSLRYSAEGRAAGRPIPGLRRRYWLHRLYRRGIAGRLLRTFTAILALPGLMADVERLWRLAATTGEQLRQSAAELPVMAARIDALGMAMRQEAGETDRRHRQHAERLGARLDARLDELAVRVEAEPWAEPIVLLADRGDALAQRLERIGHIAERAAELARQAAETGEQEAALAARLELDKLYVAFEDRFRGTREDIKQRQSVYLDTLRAHEAGTAARPIVDVGSGRGELLELLGEAGLAASGVDLNAAMVALCQARGLACVQADAVAYLEALAPGSLGAVTGFHIIEHLPYPVMVALFDASLRALAPGGLVIFETPNPANLAVASRWFHLDPTHRNPLPAEMVSMIATARGFSGVEIRELHPIPARFEAQDEALGAQLDALFHGPQDYALIARKAG